MKIQETAPEAYISSGVQTYSASIAMTKEVFNILVKGIYKYPYMAIVREYICNGRDGHVAAGHRNPLYVHIPTDLEPWFAIKDSGVGMSYEMVTTTFMCLGSSTKRESNDFIGAKGIGSKSAFSTGDQFQVISTYDGVKSSYVVYMNKGVPDIAVVSELPTEEPNGVEVKIAIESDKISLVQSSVKQFLSFFDFPVEINLEQDWLDSVRKPKFAYQEKVGDFDIGILAEGQQKHIKNKIVMGGVAYESNYLENTCTEDCVVIVPIGKVDISPGREYTEEADNPEFVKELQEAFEVVKNNYYESVLSGVDESCIVKASEYYNTQTSQAKKIIHDYFYTEFLKELDESVTVYTNHRRSWKHVFSGKSDKALVGSLLSGGACFMIKDKGNHTKARAQMCKDSDNYSAVYALDLGHPLVQEQFFSGLMNFASQYEMKSDKPKEKKERVPRVGIKGHVVHYFSKEGYISKDRFSKEEFDNIEHYMIVESSYGAENGHTKAYGNIKYLIKDLMADFNLERVYLITERQSPWVKSGKEFKVENQKHLEKELEKQLIEQSTDYNDIIDHINFLRQVKSSPSRLKQKDGYNLPKWYTRLVPDVVEKVQERAEKKEKALYEAYEKEKSDLLLAAPMLKFISKNDWTKQEVKDYVKSQHKNLS